MKGACFAFLMFFSAVLCVGGEKNLAENCLVLCKDGWDAEFAVDGMRIGRYWEGTCTGNFLQVDLGQIRKISRIRLFMWSNNKRYYQYFLTASADGKNWKEIIDERKNTMEGTEKGREYRFPSCKARYVRIYVTSNSDSKRGNAHIREIEIYEK